MSAVADIPSASWLNRQEFPFTPHYLHVEGGRMHYIDEGQGETILFLHGCPTWSYLFRSAIRQLSRAGYRCVAPDHIGFGLSEKPHQWPYSPAAHCRNVEKLIEHLGLDDVTLVMHDLGGPIGMTYAIEHPERIKRMVLMNTWIGSLENDPAAQKISKMASGPLGKFLYMNTCAGPKSIRPMFGNREKYTDEIHSAYFGPFANKEDRISTLEAAKHLTDSTAWYSDIWLNRKVLAGKPMLMIWGLKDPTFGEKALNRIWHEFPLADVTTFPDAGHLPIEERPRETVEAIRAFMTAPVKTTGFLA